MTVLTRLLSKLKAQPKTIEEQLVEFDQLPAETLQAIAAENDSEVLRLAAIARLDYGPLLIQLAFDGGVAGLQQKARQRLAELADQGALTLGQLAADGVDPMAQFAILGFCQQDDLLKQLLNASNDERFFYQIALEGVSIQLRQLAVEKIEDEACLNRLLKETKGKDKQVYKIVKGKCDGFLERDQRAAQTQAEILRRCERLEAHSQRPFDDFFTDRAEHLQGQCALLQAEASEAFIMRVQQATLACKQTIDAVLKAQADLAAQAIAIAEAAEQQGVIILKLRDRLAHLFECLASEQEIQSTQVHLNACRQAWLGAAQHNPAQKADEKAFTQLGAGIEFQLQQLQQHGSLIDQLKDLNGAQAQVEADADGDATNIEACAPNIVSFQDLQARIKTASLLPADFQPQPVLTALALIADVQQQEAEKKETEKNQLRQLSALIRKAQAAVDSGQSRPAVGIRRTIEHKQDEMARMPVYLSKELAELDTALQKLLDWKDYVVEPKKQELIEAMRSLIDSEENPEALAIKISRLQNDWKSLSQGAQDQALWETFHQLSQTAYQPCKVFFDQQGKIRRDNLDNRIQMATQLESYVSAQQWDADEATGSIDPGAIEKLMVTAIRQWRSYEPVDRARNKSVQQRFDQMLDLIRATLNAHYQKNADFKRQLIDQVQNLADEQDNRKAVDAVKRLQAQWKLTGAALRKDEQVLWKTFRKGCDAIFETRQQQAEAFKAELEVNKNAAQVLLQEVERMLALSGTALLDARVRVAECQTEYQSLGALPRGQENSLNQAFSKAIEQFGARVAHQLQAAKAQVWLDCLMAADKIRLYQVAEDAETAGVLEQAARAYIESVEQWPKNGLKALQEKMAQGASDATQDENEAALRRLCIRAEILSEQPTPDADKPRRMQYQMSRLKQGLGQKSPDKKLEMDAMVLEWVLVGPVSTVIYQPLITRFQQCR